LNSPPDHRAVRVHFLLGPAGSGKTWRCLEEIRAELKRSPDGPPLLLLAPKQATFQLERQLLESPDLAGYSRLQIVSFDRLARWLLETFSTVPELLDDEGRVMVLRALLAREQPALRVFRATARLPGFARQLSQLLREFQRHQLTPARLARLAERCTESAPLRDKLHDLHHLLRAYHEWLDGSKTQDGDQLLDLATGLVRDSSFVIRHSSFPIAGLWLDGFAEMTPQELDLLCAVLPFCRTATLAFCLDLHAADSQSWLSLWSTVRRTYLDCRQRIAALPSCEVSVEELRRDPAHSRFLDCPTLAQLEANWTAPAASAPSPPSGERAGVRGLTPPSPEVIQSTTADSALRTPHSAFPLRLALCANPEAEATLAAREILRHVRAGGRFRDCAVILRTLDHHHTALRRAFTRYDIPFFLDRREPVAHHPLAELTRFALRTLAYGWQPDDLFGALKSGLVHDRDADVDWLENLALAHGWCGTQWLEPLVVPEPKFNLTRAEHLRAHLTAPFQKLSEQLADPISHLPSPISGSALATALRDLWDNLAIESRLQAWDDALAREGDTPAPSLAPPLHATVLRQMHEWLDNLERAFPDSGAGVPPAAGATPTDEQARRLHHYTLREWLPILEAGLSSLSVGVIPPALDQVLIGTIDRSRNPELQLALVLGLNEGIFPAPPAPPVLLTDTERDLLAAHDTRLGLDPRAQIAHERYFAYIACTRSRARLVLTCSAADSDGKPLHPSPILAHVQQLFPGLELEKVPATHDWREAEHTKELLEPILRELAAARSGDLQSSPAPGARLSQPQQPPAHEHAPSNPNRVAHCTAAAETAALQTLASLPALAPVIARWREITAAHAVTRLSPAAVHQLYDTELRTSVSKLEQFAECPFKFFVAAGLGAEERKEFEVDHRERGSFIHRLLDEFHTRVAASGRRWRDLSPADAATLAARVGEDLLASPEFALFAADESRRFAARSLIASAQRLLAALVGWMPHYAFDPVAVELGFGLPGSLLPAWRLDLAGGRALSLRGRIDRVDLCRDEKTGESFAVVVDYKSSPKKLDPLKIAHGLQLQLLAYLNVLSSSRREEAPSNAECGVRNVESSQSLLTSAATLPRPAGVFYVPLHGASGSTGERAEILSEDEAARRATYQHTGRFDFTHRALLDARPGDQPSGQFRYTLNKDGALSKRGGDALTSAEFTALLTQVEANFRRLGEAIFASEVSVSPVRLSASDKACDRCDYRPICRFDPWTQPYRTLPKPVAKEEEA
jgi:ATP-dependent helicase/nuclease subunit B